MAGARTNAYAKPCAECGLEATCAACVRTAGCTECTPTARCGACRTAHFQARRERADLASCPTPKRSRGPRAAGPAGGGEGGSAATAGGRLDLPRSMGGLREYLALLATQCASVAAAGGRWLVRTEDPALLHETIVVKDNYETPVWVAQHYIAAESLEVDVHASALNALAPLYVTAADGEAAIAALRGQRLWLNPAYGARCIGIEPALRRLMGAVRVRGCTLVALLPAVNFGTWFHEFVQQAHEVHYLRDKVGFLNPYMDGVLGEYIPPLLVAIWRPGPPPASPPVWQASEARRPEAAAQRAGPADLLRVRRCTGCGVWRLLPRHQVESVGGEGAAGAGFRCEQLADGRRNWCGGPHVVCTWS